MSAVDHEIFNLYLFGKGLAIGDGSYNLHIGIKDEYLNIEHIVIPSFVNGKPIICLRYRCLRDLLSLLTVYIPRTIESFDGDAFTLCSKLNTIIFEENSIIKSVDGYSFHSTSITTITLPKTLQKINKETFSYCKKLKTIVITNFLTTDESIFTSDVPKDLKIIVPVNYPYDTFGSRNVTKCLPAFYGLKPLCRSRVLKTYYISNSIFFDIILFTTI